MYTDGIFDTQKDPNKRLWCKTHPKFDPKIKDSFHFIAYKSDKKTKKIGKRNFFIKKKFLCYKRKLSKNNYSGLIDLSWVRAEFKEEENISLRKDFPYCVVLIAERKFTSIHFKDIEEATKWREALKNIAVMIDFHKRYDVLKWIENGNYGQVIFINKIFFLNFLFKFFSKFLKFILYFFLIFFQIKFNILFRFTKLEIKNQEKYMLPKRL